MIRALRDNFVFFKEFGTRFQTTGSILPSSRFLAKAITSHLRKRGDEPIRVLECGPGTGAFTNAIVRHLREGDTFDLVELNDSFVQILKKRFDAEPHWKSVRELSKIHECGLQEFGSQGEYDFIISGIPHVNLPGPLVKEITAAYFRLLKPAGTLSYFEYAFIRPIRVKISGGASGERLQEVNRIMEGHRTDRLLRRDTVWCNIPPAWVQHLSGTKQSD